MGVTKSCFKATQELKIACPKLPHFCCFLYWLTDSKKVLKITGLSNTLNVTGSPDTATNPNILRFNEVKFVRTFPALLL